MATRAPSHCLFYQSLLPPSHCPPGTCIRLLGIANTVMPDQRSPSTHPSKDDEAGAAPPCGGGAGQRSTRAPWTLGWLAL